MPGGVLRSSLRLKNNSLNSGENAGVSNNMKRKQSASDSNLPPPKKATRAAFGDITNAHVGGGNNGEKKTLKTQMKKSLSNLKHNFSSSSSNSSTTGVIAKKTTAIKKSVKKAPQQPPKKKEPSPLANEEKEEMEAPIRLPPPSSSSQEDLVKKSRNIELSEDEEENYESANEDLDDASMIVQHSKSESPVKKFGPPEGVIDYDAENMNDPHQCSAYAWDIFQYYKQREPQFAVEDYIQRGVHPEVTEMMRAILIDWLVEVQESFELNHETLYTAVKVVDLYLSKEQEPIKKENLQLVGATACLIACKTDERIPPLLDDFVYVCDDAYSREEIIDMERKIIQTIDYDVGFPLSYRFLRRYGRVCKVTMPVLTFARFILETALMEYELNIHVTSESKLAVAAMMLALKVKGITGWADTLAYYSGYSLTKECGDLVHKLLKLLKREDNSNLKTIKQKYSHVVFHEVAKIPLPESVEVTE